ncbi:MAG: hypothetical protein Q9M91_01085 [Candidatus Dojkabacteria bacterium]|nr:hypothetical protein [Candidatus Dojkabacteria bacterium]MDQ7020421.1 hypothetical protein [Candidatus Dojkabacteria bacterium]
MSKQLALVSVLILAVVAVGGYFLMSDSDDKDKNEDETQQEEREENDVENEEESESESADSDIDEIEEDAVVAMEGPVAFSEIGLGIMDAADVYAYFTFENGVGNCMDQGFPTDLVYDSENIVKTEDGSYSEDWTSVDFSGRIRFDALPLSTGDASCVIETSSVSDQADVTCSVEEVEVCTATFDIFGY